MPYRTHRFTTKKTTARKGTTKKHPAKKAVSRKSWATKTTTRKPVRRVTRPTVKKMAKPATRRTARSSRPYTMNSSQWNWTPSKTKKAKKRPTSPKSNYASPSRKSRVWKAKPVRKTSTTVRRRTTRMSPRRRKW